MGDSSAAVGARTPEPERPRALDRRVAFALFSLVLVVLVGQGALALAHVRAIEQRRDHEAAEPPGSVESRIAGEAGRWAAGLAVARRTIVRDGGRFAIVFGADVSASDRRTIRLVTGATMLPATGAADPFEADYLVAVGQVPAELRAGFGLVTRSDGVWVGRRPG